MMLLHNFCLLFHIVKIIDGWSNMWRMSLQLCLASLINARQNLSNRFFFNIQNFQESSSEMLLCANSGLGTPLWQCTEVVCKWKRIFAPNSEFVGLNLTQGCWATEYKLWWKCQLLLKVHWIKQTKRLLLFSLIDPKSGLI